MKHSLKITLVLLVIFLLAQFIGLAVLWNYIDAEQSMLEGKTVFKEGLVKEPTVKEQTYFPFIVLGAILIGTMFLFLMMKYKLMLVWKIWFTLAVVVALDYSFNAFMWEGFALALALGLGLWKVFKPNVWIQNGTELFIYGGLAAIFVPLFSLWAGVVLLVLISIYDAYAVWKSKHMIKLAKSQMKAKIFAGLFIPYKLGKLKKPKKGEKTVKKKVRTAMLGGGDIGFPLIFAGIVLKEIGLWQALLIPLFAAAGLWVIFWKGDKEKFYPAMPFISAGCFLGLLVVWLIGMI
ncbi:hypothetical protein HOC13_02040 [Candidatus Woesearchaeota archaeon]|jgi:presenilin-like A22 family membrane protease|nr:hypothetical protein [Candidatus Woesearchaeota archaeon]